MKTMLIAALFFAVPLAGQDKPSFLRDKPVWALAAVHGALAFADAAQTEHYWKLAQPTIERPIPGYFRERNPLARPFIGHPAALYSADAAYIIGTAWLAHRMRTSNNKFLRKIWWVPQVAGSGGAVFGIVATRLNYH